MIDEREDHDQERADDQEVALVGFVAAVEPENAGDEAGCTKQRDKHRMQMV
jgi:hypothetical protein